MQQQAAIDRIEAALADDLRFRALFLAGSFGRGTADEFSDLDFIALVEPADHEVAAAAWQRAVESISPVVFWNRRVDTARLLNAITEDWLRVDLYMVTPAAFLERSSAARYSRATLVSVIDRDGVFEDLPATTPGGTADRRQIEYIISEFIRVLGLIAVGMGRGEHVLGVTGAGLLRDLLVRLMIEETLSPERGGALHLSRTLTERQMAELTALPYPGPTRAEVLQAHWALARSFFPRARRIALKLDIEWPSAFEDATRRHLERSFGAEMEPW